MLYALEATGRTRTTRTACASTSCRLPGSRASCRSFNRHREDYPQGLFQCLWNSCWWYDCSEAAVQYDPPPGGWPPEGPPWSRPESVSVHAGSLHHPSVRPHLGWRAWQPCVLDPARRRSGVCAIAGIIPVSGGKPCSPSTASSMRQAGFTLRTLECSYPSYGEASGTDPTLTRSAVSCVHGTYRIESEELPSRGEQSATRS